MLTPYDPSSLIFKDSWKKKGPVKEKRPEGLFFVFCSLFFVFCSLFFVFCSLRLNLQINISKC
jgi:hypothetical protein